MALWNRALTEPEIARLYGTGRALEELVTDLDEDRLPDFWEQRYGLEIGKNDEFTDPDGDGLTNAYEYLIGTSPISADTDADGLADSVEDRTGRWTSPARTGTDPAVADSDGDSLLDGTEVMNGTDPNREDTDADGESDWTEDFLGSDPNVPEPLPMIEEALVAYWPFDGELDDEIQGFAGTAHGSPITFAPGQFYQGALLNGTDQYIEVEETDTETSSAFDLAAQSFSVSAWLTFDPASHAEPVLLDFSGGNAWAFRGTPFGNAQLLAPGSGAFSSILSGDISTADATMPIRDGDLHHVVLIFKNTISRIYVDGVKSEPILFTNSVSIRFTGSATNLVGVSVPWFDLDGATNPGSFTNLDNGQFDFPVEGEPAKPSPGKLTFGFAPGAATPLDTFWKGMVDDVGIWKRALTEAEVLWIWNRGTGRSLGEILHPEDDDADGLPDAWESSYTSSNADLSATADPDQDGP
ncbi:MAG: hypothetical protein ACI9DF_004473, partial [Verrucomicrobiales bacterium]